MTWFRRPAPIVSSSPHAPSRRFWALGGLALALPACGSPAPEAAPRAAPPVASSADDRTPASPVPAADDAAPDAAPDVPDAERVAEVEATYADLIARVKGRTTTSLSGPWHAIVDPYEYGYYDYRYEPKSDHWGLDKKPQDKSDRIEYDFDQSATLEVPGDWNSQRPELYYYEGTIWYKRAFEAPNTADGRRIFVHFGAANYQAVVYLNGERIGDHVGGFTPFEFEITDQLRAGSNTLIVKVDNARHRDGVPTINTDWWNFGGLTRDVLLIDVPTTFIRDYFVQLDPAHADRISGWVRLDGPERSQSLTLKIDELGIAHTVQTDPDGYGRFEVAARPELWSDRSPKRYDVTWVAQDDRITDQIGFRTVATDGAKILLNGESIYLRGISIHEQAPGRPGRATSEADARRLLGWAKELGANFVRLAHYPHNEHMVEVADELGILVWSEVPVYWTILWDNPATFDNARGQLSEMITRDKNRAAVVLWSVGNETPVSEPRTSFLTRLVQTTRALDPTRLTTAALERHYVDDHTQMIDDPLGQVLDVVGVNEYIGWYDGLPEKADTIVWKTAFDKPIVISEFGAGAKAGFHADALTRWSEEFQADVYARQLAMLEKVPQVRGMSPWILADFQSPRRALPHIQDDWNRKGLVSDAGVKKRAFFVLRDFYREHTVSRSP